MSAAPPALASESESESIATTATTSPPCPPLPLCPPSPLDINSSAPAVLEWTVNDKTHHLCDPDPRSGDLVLESRYQHASSSGSFTIRIPIRLKGIDCNTQVLLVIRPCSIASLEHEIFPVAPDVVHKKLNCRTVCLRFRLRDPVDVVFPMAVPIPLQPKRRPSGEVLDALRLLSQATVLAVYVPDRELPTSKIEAVCNTIVRTQLQPLERQYDLGSLYGGAGGKIIDMTTSIPERPPSYDELEPPPPIAPLEQPRVAKRRRLHSREGSDETDSRFDVIWSELIKMRKEKTEYDDRMQKLEGRVEKLEKQKEVVEQELAAVLKKLEDAIDFAQVAEANIIGLQQGLDELEEQVDGLMQNGLDSDVEERITDNVTERVFDNIFGQSLNTTITFERHGE